MSRLREVLEEDHRDRLQAGMSRRQLAEAGRRRAEYAFDVIQERLAIARHSLSPGVEGQDLSELPLDSPKRPDFAVRPDFLGANVLAWGTYLTLATSTAPTSDHRS